MSTVDLEIQIAVPFDHDLFVDLTILGAVVEFPLGSHTARLELPGDVMPESRGLQRPASAPDSMTHHLPNGHWGIKDASLPYATIGAAMVSIPGRASIDFELSEDQIGGKDIQTLVHTVSRWFDSLVHWLRVLTSQSLDPANPDPKVIHRNSRNVVVMGTATASGSSSVPASMSPLIEIIVSSIEAASEHAVNRQVLERAVKAAGTTPSTMLELLASARMAARRGDIRRALIDCGTSAEAALSQALGLAANHGYTLGGLVSQAFQHGLKIPADTKVALVNLRNDAVHRGQVAPGADVNRALQIVEELVSLAETDLIPVSSLTPVFRPQRLDMVIIRPPVKPSNPDVTSTQN